MFGDRLRSLRTQRGLSQEGLAEEVGVRGQQIWRYEKGDNTPAADVLAQIARALGTSADYLIGLTDDPSLPQTDSGLSEREQFAISAWRRGDRLEAIKVIATDE